MEAHRRLRARRTARPKIGIQLAHAGRKGSTRRLWEGIDEPLDRGQLADDLGPSPIPYFPHSQVPREMDRADMDAVRDDFVRATRMAEEAGFDLLELHFAHGYLLASFLSPLTNRRSDEYGGALENRLRFPLEVFDAVRAAWPAAKPISVRISATDWKEGGLSPRRRRRGRARAKDARLRHRRRVGRQHVPDQAPDLRPPVPDAVRRPRSATRPASRP